MTARARSDILFNPLRASSTRFYLLVTGLLAVVGWGIYAYNVQLTTGLGVTGMRSVVLWGVYIINFVFFIGISHVGALMSAILRLTNAEWRRPITRIAEVVTFASLIIAALFPLIDLGRPERLLNLALYARLQSPLIWDFIAILTYFVGSALFLYLPLIPDIAACRDRLDDASGWRKRVYGLLSLRWRGSEYEWRHLESAIKVMAIIIIPLAISVHTVVSWDFAMTLRTGWNSTIFGPYFVGGAILSGVATVILIMAVLRKLYHLEAYLTERHFDNLAKLLLALDIILVYLTINEFLVPGYKFLQQSNLEGQWLHAMIWGPYAPVFWRQVIGGLIVPAVLIALPKTRNIAGYFMAALLVDIGMWLERFSVVVASLAVPQLDYPWGVYLPTWVEFSITAAGFAGFILIYLAFTKLFPIISMWENREGQVERQEEETAEKTAAARAEHSDRVSHATPSASRRGFLKTSATAFAGLALGLASSRLLSSAARTVEEAFTRELGEQRVSLSVLGESTPVESLGERTRFFVAIPSLLPPGTNLKEVRVTDGGRFVALLYRNPGLRPLSIYSEEVAVVVLQTYDPRVDGPPTYLPDRFSRVEVAGKRGFAREPAENEVNGRLEPGRLQWWSGGVRRTVLANLSVAQLRSIGASMEAGRRG